MEFLTEYGMFLAKTLTFVVALLVIVGALTAAAMRTREEQKGHIEITKLNEKYDEVAKTIRSVVLSHEAFKAAEKNIKKADKEAKKKEKAALKQAKNKESSEKTSEILEKRVYVADFHGDIKASATNQLREVITAILSVANKQDEVVVRLESQGGMVHSYGLAASQLARITAKEIPLTVCVDKVAASGGYMMACVANKIVAAPFAIIGSIGVVAQLPNFHRLLKKHDVDYEMITAGEYKRTLTMFGENTEKGRRKFAEDIEDTHDLFKEYISEHRNQVEIEKVATGEIWFGKRALDEKLVDGLQTSDEYLLELKDNCQLFKVKFVQKKSIPEKIGASVEAALDRTIVRWLSRANNKIYS